MDGCCRAPGVTASRDGVCPASGNRGTPVKLLTVKALLTEPALARLAPLPHRFCADAACPVVYYDTAGQQYTAADLRVPVWQKEPPGARLLCYCFGETEAGIRAEIERSGRSDAPARIRRHIDAGRCACEVRNPRGACCLGDVLAAVSRLTRAVAEAAPGAR
ncbi:MAG TPA: hypothetical protein VNI83_15560 [Vicinamibacterales bacterium]|nr:hypothetical protein [Vicinamibacterales bacterium]